MKYPAYPAYKDSGLKWLGKLPRHWEVKRLKTAATYRVSNVDKVPAVDELPIRLCNYTDVYYNDHIRPTMALMETSATADEVQRFGLRINDVVITKDSEEWDDIAIPALVAETAPDLVCGYHLAVIRPDGKTLSGPFLFRAFQACSINRQFQIRATGVTRYGLPKSAIGEAWLPLPSPEEQNTIASYLDVQTEKLDTLLAKKRELIEKLKEKRTALISSTVTHGLPPAAAKAAGLNPKPKLKPSGIDWLGDVPEHWTLGLLGRFFRLQRGFDISGADEFDIGNPVISSGGISGRTDSPPCKGPGVIIGRKGTLGTVYYSDIDYWPHDTTLWIKDFKKNLPKFCYYYLKHLNLEYLDNGASNPTLNRNYVHPIPIAFPPLPEQIVLTGYLDRETSKIDLMIEKVEAAVEKLREYRAVLITAAVTGKIDVRKAAV